MNNRNTKEINRRRLANELDRFKEDGLHIKYKLTNQTNVSNGFTLVKDVDPRYFKIRNFPRNYAGGVQSVFLTKLDHAWLDPKIIHNEFTFNPNDNEPDIRVSPVVITPYKRHDGTYSFGFKLAPKYARINLKLKHDFLMYIIKRKSFMEYLSHQCGGFKIPISPQIEQEELGAMLSGFEEQTKNDPLAEKYFKNSRIIKLINTGLKYCHQFEEEYQKRQSNDEIELMKQLSILERQGKSLIEL